MLPLYASRPEAQMSVLALALAGSFLSALLVPCLCYQALGSGFLSRSLWGALKSTVWGVVNSIVGQITGARQLQFQTRTAVHGEALRVDVPALREGVDAHASSQWGVDAHAGSHCQMSLIQIGLPVEGWVFNRQSGS